MPPIAGFFFQPRELFIRYLLYNNNNNDKKLGGGGTISVPVSEVSVGQVIERRPTGTDEAPVGQVIVGRPTGTDEVPVG